MKTGFKWALIVLLVTCSCSDDAEDAGVDASVPQTPLSPEDDPNKKGHLFSVLSTEQEEDVALAINLSGSLCGKFIGAVPVGGMILAECQEYRKKDGHYVRYWIRGLGEGQSLRVEKAFKLKPDGWERIKS